jgi:hypothetical protein
MDDFGDPVAIKSAAEVHKVLHGTTVSVIYRPYDGDPHTVKWNGVQFRANVPVTLDRANREHHIEQLLPKQFPGTNGETLTKHIPALVFMGDMARTNPSFEVDGERARRKINTRVVPAPGQDWSEAHEGQISESDIIDDFASAYQMQGQPRQAGRA